MPIERDERLSVEGLARYQPSPHSPHVMQLTIDNQQLGELLQETFGADQARRGVRVRVTVERIAG